jgi:copper chaperone NosL
MNNRISIVSRLLLVVCGVLLVVSIFVPIWRIELDAPQYPEGLAMLIYANKLGGDVEIINGLNHYIGMQTLHAENFIEFTVLPYIIGAFALLFLLTALIAKKKMLYVTFGSFALFGVLAMVDFWRWEYNYGHNLDPHAAIIVPGMAYQPPLIGFKQLLNFGAYSIPALGGWLFIACGVIALALVLFETGSFNRFIKTKTVNLMVAITIATSLLACSDGSKPEPINLKKDNCDFCKMTIVDGRFGAELITVKGRVYKFDDLSCMVRYAQENRKTQVQSYFVSDYTMNNELIDATKAFYVHSDELRSPMGGNTAAFQLTIDAEKYALKTGKTVIDWTKVNK